MGEILIPRFDLPKDDLVRYNDFCSSQKETMKHLSSDEWYLRYLSYSGLTWRYGLTLSEEEKTLLVEKIDTPGLQKKLTETSPEELKDLSLTFYSRQKKEFLSGLSEDMQEKISRLEYELIVVHEM